MRNCSSCQVEKKINTSNRVIEKLGRIHIGVYGDLLNGRWPLGISIITNFIYVHYTHICMCYHIYPGMASNSLCNKG